MVATDAGRFLCPGGRESFPEPEAISLDDAGVSALACFPSLDEWRLRDNRRAVLARRIHPDLRGMGVDRAFDCGFSREFECGVAQLAGSAVASMGLVGASSFPDRFHRVDLPGLHRKNLGIELATLYVRRANNATVARSYRQKAARRVTNGASFFSALSTNND